MSHLSQCYVNVMPSYYVSSQSVLYECDAMIQLMHSFEVNIRICQPENSDVHQGEAEVNITFEG